MNENIAKCKEIINSKARKICVIAGPGSGKTKCLLIPKVKQVIENHSIDPDDVLVISFSRLSAQDLRERVKKEIERAPRASTLHSICLSFLLSEDNHDIRKRIETIVMDFEKQVMLSDLRIQFPQIRKNELRRMLNEFSAGWAVQPHDDVFNEDEKQREFKLAVLNWLNEHEAAMMEEIVYNAVDLAKKVKSDFIEKPQYIFVDEYQDLNKLEQEFVNLLGEKSKLVFVVGDPDQSIYSFKYAYPAGIKSLMEDESVEVHKLEYSLRCGKKIIDIANQLLKLANPERKDLLKPLPTADNGKVTLKQTDKQNDEFSFVLNDIIGKVNNGVDPKEIIVLVPRKKLGMDFVKYTREQQLPKNLSFQFVFKDKFSEAEQKKILRLGIIANPRSVLRVRSYVGLEDRDNYANEFAKLKNKYGNIREAIQNAKEEDFNKRQSKLRKVCVLLQDVRQFIKQHEEIEDVDAILDEIFPRDDEECVDIRDILTKLREDDDTIQTLYSKFLDHSQTLEARGNVVRVMTLIASKGLDAEHVYIMGCNDGNIPGNKRFVHLTDYEHKQEQKRLLFVGVTRAKKSLTITWSRHIPFSQSRRHYTDSVRVITIDGERYSQVGLSEFLQQIVF